MRYVYGFLSTLLLVTALSGCEHAPVGRLAVTWQFNGHAEEQGNNPCAGIGADRIVIELDGPKLLNEVVVCDNVSPDYPFGWLNFVTDLPVNAYGRLMRDIPKGTYQVRIFFIPPNGRTATEPSSSRLQGQPQCSS